MEIIPELKGAITNRKLIKSEAKPFPQIKSARNRN
jgi:hypothetical protein